MPLRLPQAEKKSRGFREIPNEAAGCREEKRKPESGYACKLSAAHRSSLRMECGRTRRRKTVSCSEARTVVRLTPGGASPGPYRDWDPGRNG
jgi:hypothetical protein